MCEGLQYMTPRVPLARLTAKVCGLAVGATVTPHTEKMAPGAEGAWLSEGQVLRWGRGRSRSKVSVLAETSVLSQVLAGWAPALGRWP